MRRSRLLVPFALVLAAVSTSGACLYFGGALPCSSDENCPAPKRCDVERQRCVDDVPPSDAGEVEDQDAGIVDDAGVSDDDAGFEPDGGNIELDAGNEPDAGFEDAGFADAGFLDDGRAANPEVLYRFDEPGQATARDYSTKSPPHDLVQDGTASASRQQNGALVLETSSRWSTPTAATRLAQACAATGEISVEAWVTPAASQAGPAEIVSLLLNANARDFFLGQGTDTSAAASGDRFSFRYWTTATDEGGILDANPAAHQTAANAAQAGVRSHIVFTRSSDGAVRSFKDGVLNSNSTVGGDTSVWNSSTFVLAVGNAGGAAPNSTQRDFLGTIDLLAVYCRALSQAEVTQNFNAGPNAGDQ